MKPRTYVSAALLACILALAGYLLGNETVNAVERLLETRTARAVETMGG